MENTIQVDSGTGHVLDNEDPDMLPSPISSSRSDRKAVKTFDERTRCNVFNSQLVSNSIYINNETSSIGEQDNTSQQIGHHLKKEKNELLFPEVKDDIVLHYDILNVSAHLSGDDINPSQLKHREVIKTGADHNIDTANSSKDVIGYGKDKKPKSIFLIAKSSVDTQTDRV